VTQALLCPLCRGEVALRSSGCLSCHLPMRDVLHHASTTPASRSSAVIRALRIRVIGLLLYGAVVAWCVYQLPDTVPFVVPGAVIGGGIHVWKGRPWLGLAVFAIIVVIVPALLWPSVLTGAFSDLTAEL